MIQRAYFSFCFPLEQRQYKNMKSKCHTNDYRAPPMLIQCHAYWKFITFLLNINPFSLKWFKLDKLFKKHFPMHLSHVANMLTSCLRLRCFSKDILASRFPKQGIFHHLLTWEKKLFSVYNSVLQDKIIWTAYQNMSVQTKGKSNSLRKAKNQQCCKRK